MVAVDVKDDLLEPTPTGGSRSATSRSRTAISSSRRAAAHEPAERVGALMRPCTGWCSSGSPANDAMSASVSPVIRPSKYGTAVSCLSRRSSRTRCRAGAENSSGSQGTRQASHGRAASVPEFGCRGSALWSGWSRSRASTASSGSRGARARAAVHRLRAAHRTSSSGNAQSDRCAPGSCAAAGECGSRGSNRSTHWARQAGGSQASPK